MKTLPLLLLAATALATPALARERCDTIDRTPGVHITWGFQIGDDYTPQEQEIFDMMDLRRQGINARSARRTSDGCIEAWVPDGNGGHDTLYFQPETMDLKLK